MTAAYDKQQKINTTRDRILALRAKAASSTFPAERASFNAAAERLMVIHNIPENDLHFQPLEVGMMAEHDILFLQESVLTPLDDAGVAVDEEWIRAFTRDYVKMMHWATEQERDASIQAFIDHICYAYPKAHEGQVQQNDIRWLQEATINEMLNEMSAEGLDTNDLDRPWIDEYARAFCVRISGQTESQQQEAFSTYTKQFCTAYYGAHHDHADRYKATIADVSVSDLGESFALGGIMGLLIVIIGFGFLMAAGSAVSGDNGLGGGIAILGVGVVVEILMIIATIFVVVHASKITDNRIARERH